MIDSKKRILESTESSASGLKKQKLSATAEFRQRVSSKDFSKLKKAGKTGSVSLKGFHKSDSKGVDKSEGFGATKTYEKLTKKQRKKLREKRRAYYEEAVDIKRQWEFLRAADTKEKKATTSETILNRVLDKDKLLQLCLSHDTCRVISWAYKCAKEDKRKEVFDMLFPSFEKLVQSRYGVHMALTMVKSGSKADRNRMMAGMKGKVKDWFLHCFANEVVEELYNNWANETQRALMQHEIYSRYFVMKSMDVGGDGDQQSQQQSKPLVKSLDMLLEKNPTLRNPVLKSVKFFILKCINTKSVRHSFAHKILLEYFSVMHRSKPSSTTSDDHVTEDANKEQRETRSDSLNQTEEGRSVIAEIVPLCKDWLTQMAHTPDGSKIVMYALWYSNSKERKAILKGFKEQMVQLCTHENAYLIVLAMLDSVDDTVLTNQCVLQPMLKNIPELVASKFGLKCLVYTLFPRYKTLFNVEICNLLALGDDNVNSKKDRNTRYLEINTYFAPKISQFIVESLEGSDSIAEDKSCFHLMSAFLKTEFVAISVKQPMLEALAARCVNEKDFIEAFLPYSIVKTALQEDNPTYESFSRCLCDNLEHLDPDLLRLWIDSPRKRNILSRIVDQSAHLKDKLGTKTVEDLKKLPLKKDS